MTSHITSHNPKINHDSNQSGVTLMLAVLILSAITAIAFSLAAIVTIEIRNAGDNLRTEPALYATLGVTEEALFQYRRGATSIMDVTNCDSTDRNGICNLNGVSLSPVALTEDSTPRTQTVRPNERLVIPLYLPQQFDKQYSQIIFTVLQTRTNGIIDITCRETKIDNSVNDTTTQLNELSDSWSCNNFNDNSQYEIILNNTGRTNPVTVSIDSYGADGQPKGIPYIDQQVLRVLSTSAGNLTRSYLVRIPKY